MKLATKHNMSNAGMSVTNFSGLLDIHRSTGEISNQQVACDVAHGCCGDDLVKLEAQIRFEPSPKKKVGLIEHHPRDEHWPEQTDYRCADSTISDDDGDQRGQYTQYNLYRVSA